LNIDNETIVVNIDTMQKEAIGDDIYECSSGECVSTTGYIRSSNVNYEIKLDAVSAPNTDVTDCNTLGKMKSDGTFCNVGTEVAVSTTGNYIYYNGSIYVFARVKAGIVLITDVSDKIII
jgi:hypothetical protein